jgi:hypothetical protein
MYKCNFTTTYVKELLQHLEKIHYDEFKRLVEARKESIHVLDQAIQNISDEVKK